MLLTVRSRCQTFVSPATATGVRPVAEAYRRGRRRRGAGGRALPHRPLGPGSFRDAVSTLDQLTAATEGKITVQAVMQLLGAVEEEALFRLCDFVVDRDTAAPSPSSRSSPSKARTSGGS